MNALYAANSSRGGGISSNLCGACCAKAVQLKTTRQREVDNRIRNLPVGISMIARSIALHYTLSRKVMCYRQTGSFAKQPQILRS